MSELKGQILGIVMTIVLFGVVSGAITAAFNAYKTKIQEETTNLLDDSSFADAPYFNY